MLNRLEEIYEKQIRRHQRKVRQYCAWRIVLHLIKFHDVGLDSWVWTASKSILFETLFMEQLNVLSYILKLIFHTGYLVNGTRPLAES